MSMSDDLSAGFEDVETQYRSYLIRKILFIVVFVIGCIVVAGISLTFNGRGIGFTDCYRYVIDHLLGATYEFRSPEWFDDYVLWNTYMPRIVIAIISGSGLAVCGVIMQSVLANPLADPYTTGVSDGATLGATVAIITGLTFSNAAGSMGIVTNAFIGAIIPAIILILLSSAVRMSPATCILVGTAMSGIFSGVQTLLTYSTDAERLTAALRWGIGSFNQISWDACIVPFIVTLIGVLIAIYLHKGLNLLTMGDNSAKSLGLDVERFKAVCMMVTAVVAAAIVCYVGIIGFVGLIAPHMVRMVLGGDNKYVIPASMLTGSFLLLFSDLLSRVLIYPDELRVGLIMSVIGAPIFLYMIVRRKKGYGEVFRWGSASLRGLKNRMWRSSTATSSRASACSSWCSPPSPSSARSAACS